MVNSPDTLRIGRSAEELRLLCVGFGPEEERHPLIGASIAQKAVFCDNVHIACDLIDAQSFEVVVLNCAASKRSAAAPKDALHFSAIFEAARRAANCAVLALVKSDEAAQSSSQLPAAQCIDVVEWIPTQAPAEDLLWRLCASMHNEVRLLSALRAAKTEVQQQNRCDALTGLASRDWLLERVNLSITLAQEDPNQGFALLYIDLDSFKMVNDSQGHNTGDRLLMHIASRIAKTVQRSDVVARMGADEFIVLLKGQHDPEATMEVATTIQEAIAEPCCVKDRTLYLSASIGAAHFCAQSHHDALDLLRDAATALHAAKLQGRGGRALFGTDLRERAVLLFDIENELPQAIANNQLRVFYQPIFRLCDQALVGCEALVRWQHPQRGLIPPPQFISVAEDTGSIVPLGQFVLNEACKTVHGWNQGRGDEHSIYVSVNVSPRQFEGFKVNDQIKTALQQSGLDPECLAVEITENLCIRNIESTIVSLKAIRDLGVSVFLDDFGTGYSSLSHLVNLPLSLVKIDRAFVREMLFRPELDKLIRGIVSLAQGLDLPLTAEGIEEVEQQQRLRSIGVSFGQGFYYARPLSSSGFAKLVKSSRRRAA